MVAKNPSAGRKKAEPSKLLVVFMNSAPTKQDGQSLPSLAILKEVAIHGREVYIYYPEGMARPKIPLVRMKRRFNAPPPAETGTPLTSYWRSPKSWRTRRIPMPPSTVDAYPR